MSFKRQKSDNYYLYNTAVENIFLSEYMSVAPGDYVKVYLYALMYADLSLSTSHAAIAKQLGLPVEDVLKAWSYWEAKGVVRKMVSDPENPLNYKVELLNLKEQLFNCRNKVKEKKTPAPSAFAEQFSDETLKKLYRSVEQATGRLLDGKEPAAILGWIQDYQITPEMVEFAYQYCAQTMNRTKASYVHAVLKKWAELNLKTVPEIKEYLSETDQRHNQYKRILKSLGCHRNATEEEQRIIDTWFDEHRLTLEQVLTACNKTSGITNPNINYVNAVLTGDKKKSARKTNETEPLIRQVQKAYEADRQRREQEAAERRQEVYQKIPRIKEIEEELRNIAIELSRLAFGGDRNRGQIGKLKRQSEQWQAEKAYLLTDHNFSPDYLEVRYECPVCNDTGVLGSGEHCACFIARMAAMERVGKKI